MRWPVAALVASLSLAGACTRRPAPPPQVAAPVPTAAPRASDLPRVGRFVGVLPCPDCSGMQAELTLAADWEGRSLFHLTQTYMDGPNERRVTEMSGTWATRRGSADDASAVVYHLEPEPPAMARDFVVIDEREIRLLGPDLAPLPANEPATLTRADGR